MNKELEFNNKKYMQKTIKFFMYGFVLAAILMSGCAYAADTDVTSSTSQISILPNNPLYLFKDFGRELQVFFTFNPTKKAELRLEFSGQKLAEVQQLVEKNPGATAIISKALDGYKKETDNLVTDAKNLKQDSQGNQNLLGKLSEQVFNSQKILDNLASKNIVQQKIEEIKNSSLDNITGSIFKIASPDKAKDAIENATNSSATGSVNAVDKVNVIQKIQERAPGEAKKAIIEATKNIIESNVNSSGLSEDQKNKLLQVAEGLKSTAEYRQIVIEDYANKIINNNPELFSTLNNISDADKEKLKKYAESVLQQGTNINVQKVLNDLNSLNISNDSKKIIDDIQSDVVNKVTSGEISCINVTNPVCGKDGKTYSNVCESKKVGVEVSYFGKCGECAADGKVSLTGKNCCPGLIFCPANAISAAAANINGLCKKTCDKTGSTTDTNTDTGACVQTWDPVCGVNGKTYSNECFIKKAAVEIQYKGECKVTSTTPSTTVANPASTYCKEQGYANEIRTNNDGSQYGMCIFAAGKECEEWAFYRGQCGETYKRYLNITKPVTGESVCIGNLAAITWESSGVNTIKIVLVSSSGTTYSLAEQDAKTSFSWTAGNYGSQTLQAGDYQIKITSIPYQGEKEITATSNTFKLTKCVTTTTTNQ